MPQPRNYQTEAIIIKKTKLGEADRILTLYTPHLGKIQGVAKGIRRPRAKLAGHLELLTHSHVSLARGRNLDTITGSQTINSFFALKSDLWSASCALYATELVNQFTPDHLENYPLFQLLLSILHRLCQNGDKEMVLRYFEMHLLHEVGYRPQLQQCVACRRDLEPVINSFSYSAGGVLCPACRHNQPARSVSVNALQVFRLLQGDDFDTVTCLRIDPPLSHEMESMMRGYLRYLLEREVKSAAWLDTLRAQNMTISATSHP